MLAPAPPVRTGRLVVVLGLAGFASALTTRALDPLLPQVAAEFGTSVERTALLASAFALPYALVQPVLGPVGDALGKRRVILACSALLVLALLAGALATTLPTLVLARILAGAAAGGITPLSLATFGDAVPMAERQVAMSRFLAWVIGGQVAGGLLSGLVADALGWHGVLGVCTAVGLLAALVLWRDGQGGHVVAGGRVDPVAALRRYGEILTNPAALPLYLGVAIEGVLLFSLFPFLAAILQDRGIGATREAGLTSGAFGIGGFAYAGLAGLMLRRLGQASMMRLGGALAALGLSAVAVAAEAWVVIGSGVVLGLGFFMLHNSIQVRVTEVAPGARGSAVALHAFSFFLGQSLGPALFGLLQGAVGATATLLGSAAGLAALGVWVGSRRWPPAPRFHT